MSDNTNSKAFYFRSGDLSFKRAEDGKKFYVEGYVATGDLDKGNDIITKACLDDIYDQFENKNLKLDFEHETLVGRDQLDAQRNLTLMPLGKRTSWARDEKGVKIGWELNPAWKRCDKDGKVTMTFDELWGAVEGKFLDGFSIGYIPTEVTERDKKGVRKLKKLNMLTSALTGTPMNPEADMTRAFAKSLDWINNKLNKGENMTEDKVIVEDKVDDVKDPKVIDETAESKTEEKTKVDENLIEIKSRLSAIEAKNYEGTIAELKSEIDTLRADSLEAKKENTELKSIVEKAQTKAISQGKAALKAAEAAEEPEKPSTDFINDLR